MSTPSDRSVPAASIDDLQAGLFCLLSRYAAAPSAEVAEAVVAQLNALCRHPHIDLLPIQARAYCRLLNEWRARRPWRVAPASGAPAA
jgi:hypothetical protein